jgi:hypothetical protein
MKKLNKNGNMQNESTKIKVKQKKNSSIFKKLENYKNNLKKKLKNNKTNK